MIQNNCSLTETQIQHYETFGFVVRHQVFDLKEIEKLNDEFENHLVEMKKEFEQKKDRPWPNWSNLTPSTPYIAGLLEDPRICVPIEQLLGDDVFPVYSNSNSMNKETSWHPDMIHSHIRGLKTLVYLQPTTADRGALRVIPGSHKTSFSSKLMNIGLCPRRTKSGRNFLEEANITGEDIPSFAFNSEPGDVVTINQNVWHAAFNCFEDRRLCSFGFYSNPKTTQEEAELKALVKRSGAHKKELTMSSQSQYYHSWWLKNPKKNPRRSRWIKSLDNWGFIQAMNNN
jgi:ectoine hydroxylase-related dioxygenase (phytanoyl-CoA dioxygenase family)